LILYHVTTPRKARQYRASGQINRIVRGFTTLLSAMAWAIQTGRAVIYQVDTGDLSCWKMPDHHNEWGEAWWVEGDVPIGQIKCVFSANREVWRRA
jgi:hypothetical protein